jgi:hypothetical protein
LPYQQHDVLKVNKMDEPTLLDLAKANQKDKSINMLAELRQSALANHKGSGDGQNDVNESNEEAVESIVKNLLEVVVVAVEAENKNDDKIT